MAGAIGKALDLPILKRILGYSKPYKGRFWLTLFLTIFLGVLSPVRPYLIQLALDDYILTPNPEGLKIICIILVALLVIEAIVQFYQVYLANWLGQSVLRDIRMKVYRKILAFKLQYFDKTAIGTLVTRAVSDIETIGEVFSQGILTMIADVLKLVAVVSIMLWTNWQLALICLTPIPLLLIATNIFKRAIKSAFQDVRTQVGRLNAFVQEHLTGMSIVQIFNREEREMNKFKKINEEHRAAHIKSVWAYSVFLPVVEIFSALSIALLIWWGSGEVLQEYIKPGVLVAFLLYIYMLYRPIRMLADRFNTLQMGMVAGERVFKVLDTEADIEDIGKRKADSLVGKLHFDDVWFAYNDEEWILKGLTFDIEPGQTVAFVGATGAGKTSIINLLSRYYEFQKGNISIDGVEIRDYELDSLRENVGVVLQDVFLFSDSVHNNITLNNPQISREQVVEAAKVVGAHSFIERLPGGYDYDVKERGGMLSVGQRQLIAFIRAYVYDPRILVLDEATSSVDTESEELIQTAIRKLTEGRTSLVIAHRLATIQQADKIIVLDNGEIIEQGNHQELLTHGGHYHRLFELQYKHA